MTLKRKSINILRDVFFSNLLFNLMTFVFLLRTEMKYCHGFKRTASELHLDVVVERGYFLSSTNPPSFSLDKHLG